MWHHNESMNATIQIVCSRKSLIEKWTAWWRGARSELRGVRTCIDCLPHWRVSCARVHARACLRTGKQSADTSRRPIDSFARQDVPTWMHADQRGSQANGGRVGTLASPSADAPLTNSRRDDLETTPSPLWGHFDSKDIKSANWMVYSAQWCP